MLNEENLISTLGQSLRQTRNAESRLLARLREVESEAEMLRSEIEALQNSAEKTEEAIDSLFATMRKSNKSWKIDTKVNFENDDYELQAEAMRYQRPNAQIQKTGPTNNYRANPVAYINNARNAHNNNPHPEPKNHRFTDRTITQACTLILREATSPLHVNELFNLLVEGGFEFKGNNPTISIAVSLNRNRRFRKVAPGTFDLMMRDASQAVS